LCSTYFLQHNPTTVVISARTEGGRELRDDDILILKGSEVNLLLAGQELRLIDTVRMAYEAHGRGESSLPHSTFLRFPHNPRDRIIALPAYLGGEWGIAGIKWVASFPGNLELGMDRASALIVLNSSNIGRPEAILEGSLISAKRTAASAALAAQWLCGKKIDRVGLVGGGLINFEIVRFLLVIFPEIKHFVIYDLKIDRAEQFRRKCQETFGVLEMEVAKELKAALRGSSLISFATTASTPYIEDLSEVIPSSTILHISLRDLSPHIIISCDNVVDDIDHVCRAQTSVHLAEQLTGNRGFLRCTLADILTGKTVARRDAESTVVFSPFGLGILDLALADLVRELGLAQGKGTMISSFLPEPWVESHHPQ
jgi:2,3-diaminopropionate biosynthesis protein SbnB